MKIITAIYGCQYCEFTSDSPKITGKHEHTCEHNPKIKDTKAENKFKVEKAYKRKQIIESKSLTELNERLFSYLKEYYSSFSGGELIRNCSGVWYYQVKVENCKLSFNYAIQYELKLLGISIKTEDYINLAPLLSEIHEINQKYEVYNKAFKNYKDPLLTEYRQNNDEIIDLNKGIEHISKRINELINTREQYKTDVQNIENDYIKTLKDEYNWVDYQDRLKQLKSILDIK